MDPVSAISGFANDWGPLWGLVIVLLGALAWMVRELFRVQRYTLEERAQSRAVIQRLIAAVNKLSERLQWRKEQ
jgi:hypothetical protein